MKRLVLALGVIGFIGCFLPLAGGTSWFDLRHVIEGWTVWLVIAAFAAPVLVGLSRAPMRAMDAIGVAACFGYVAYKLHGSLWNMIVHGQIGGRMMGVAAVFGCLLSAFSLVSVAKTRAS